MAIISTTLKGPKRLYPQCDTDITQKTSNWFLELKKVKWIWKNYLSIRLTPVILTSGTSFYHILRCIPQNLSKDNKFGALNCKTLRLFKILINHQNIRETSAILANWSSFPAYWKDLKSPKTKKSLKNHQIAFFNQKISTNFKK